MAQWSTSNHNHAAEYLVSGWPYYKTFTLPTGVVFKVDLPATTNFVWIVNLTTPDPEVLTDRALRIGTTLEDVDFGIWPPTEFVDCAIVLPGQQTADLKLKSKTLYLKSNDGNDIYISILVGCNNVPRRNFPTLEERADDIEVNISPIWVNNASGFQQTLALDYKSNLLSWGRNNFGQLGDGTNDDRTTPGLVSTPTGHSGRWTSFSIDGDLHVVGIDSENRLWSWGWNVFGQLGNGTIDNKNVPTLVTIPMGHTGLWRSADPGSRHSLGIEQTGKLWAWGNNVGGRLGDGTINNTYVPVAVLVSSGHSGDWRCASAGANHSLGVDSNGNLWAWGGNLQGQLGLNDTERRLIPTLVNPPVGHSGTWTKAYAGSNFSFGLDTNGKLWAWGSSIVGALGVGDNLPRLAPAEVQVTGLTQPHPGTWNFISPNGNQTLGIDSNGKLWAWGFNNRGQLGDGTTINKNIPTPVIVPMSHSGIWADASAGFSHSSGIDTYGKLWTWGENFVGQLGDGNSGGSDSTFTDPPDKSSPIQINRPPAL